MQSNLDIDSPVSEDVSCSSLSGQGGEERGERGGEEGTPSHFQAEKGRTENSSCIC